MKWSIKLCSLLCSFLLCLICLPPRPAKVKAIHHVWMEVATRKVGMKATYKFHFSIEKTVKVHDWIKLYFPKEAILPGDPEKDPPPPKDPGKIPSPRPPGPGFGNCDPCEGIPIFNYEENSMKFNSHIELDPSKEGYRDITVTVPEVAGIKNPTKPGFYTCKISTQPEPTPVESTPFEIVESRIGVPEGMPEVTVMPPSIRANASYQIGFKVGRGGWLKEGDSRIRIKFPEGTAFSKESIPADAVLVNGKACLVGPTLTKTQLTLVTPIEIKDSGRVEIVIKESAGILNPTLPGDYKIEVSTMPADPEWTPSAPYHIEKGGAILRVVPARINKPAEYSFAFIVGDNQELAKGGMIKLEFPIGTGIPKTLDPTHFLINDKEALKARVDGLVLSLDSPISAKTGEAIEIKIDAKAVIVTPSLSGEIRLGYKLGSENEFLYTLPVTLKENKLDLRELTVHPNNAGAKAEYTFSLTLGDKGALKEGDFIGITFPEGTSLPITISPDNVLLEENGSKNITIDGNTLKIYLTLPMKAESNLTIQIEKKAGIRNPTKYRADYLLSVFTSAEPSLVSSSFYTIQPPLPDTTIVITGGMMGKNGWYTESPLIDFKCSDAFAKIYCYFDDRIDQMYHYDGNPKPLEPGQFESKITYYADGIYGIEEPKEAIIKMDNLNPEFVLEYPKEKKSYTKDNTLLLRGHVTLTKTYRFGQAILDYDKNLTINTIPLAIDQENRFFSYEYPLKPGENKLVLRLEDEAGRTMEKEYFVYSDSVPPTIDITFPLPTTVLTSRAVKITGFTDDPNALLLVNGNVSVVEPDGTFSYELPLEKVGKVKIWLEATDPVGNYTKKELMFWFGYTIVLKIGHKTGTTNEAVQNLNVAPFIQQGRTLVPFRFIGEQLGASIEFTIDPINKRVKTVRYQLDSIEIILSIGESKAIVNDKPVVLEVPPQIISGSTVVPLRFVTESLGCSVIWEAKTQTITLQYPKV